ncbi:MAG: hypothetical protein V4524_00895 [Patescibacteria group bacterium]
MNYRTLVSILGSIGLILGLAIFYNVRSENIAPKHAGTFTHQRIHGYEDLPVGIYQYYDVWSFGSADGYHDDLMTVVMQVNITGKDVARHQLSTVEVDGRWIPITLPRHTSFPGQTVRSSTPTIFTGLLEVNITKEGTKNISVYYPFTGGPQQKGNQ